MDLVVKHFGELTVEELFEIYKLRVTVFIVEQKCPYQEVDDADKTAYHLYLKDENGIQAYARVFKRAKDSEATVGRVIAVRRRCGLGSRIVSEGIRIAREKLGAKRVVLHAQTYTRGLYEKLGFVPISEPFLEDGIPHIEMTLAL